MSDNFVQVFGFGLWYDYS